MCAVKSLSNFFAHRLMLKESKLATEELHSPLFLQVSDLSLRTEIWLMLLVSLSHLICLQFHLKRSLQSLVVKFIMEQSSSGVLVLHCSFYVWFSEARPPIHFKLFKHLL